MCDAMCTRKTTKSCNVSNYPLFCYFCCLLARSPTLVDEKTRRKREMENEKRKEKERKEKGKKKERKGKERKRKKEKGKKMRERTQRR